MSKNEDRLLFGFVGFVLLFCALLMVYALYLWSPWGCEARWPTYETEWTLGGNCLVVTDDGLIREKAFRYAEVAP